MLLPLGAYANPPGSATVVLKCVSLASSEDPALSMYAKLKLIRCATDLRRDADKNLMLEQKRYKKDHDQHIPSSRFFRFEDYIFLSMPPLFRLAAERSSSEWYNKLLSHN